jgi:Major Facilitator Superfamily
MSRRARAFGVISGMAGVGAAAGPLIGGLITTGISWRAAFLFQVGVIAIILFLGRRIVDPVAPDPTRPFDTGGAILSAVGMFFVVFGILLPDNDAVLTALFLAVGAALLLWFSSTSARASGPARSRSSRWGCSGTACPTSAWSLRTSSG